MFCAFLFNLRNYSPEVIDIQRREAQLNIVLLILNNFNIKQKKAWNICFIICHQRQTRSGKKKDNKTQQISVTTQVFGEKLNYNIFKYIQLLVNQFRLLLLIFFSEIINP